MRSRTAAVRHGLILVSLVAFAPAAAFAQQTLDLKSVSYTLADATIAAAPATVTAETRPQMVVPAAAPASTGWSSKPLRTTLFGSFVALQALDTASTMIALRSGGVESNPMMGPIAHNAAAFIGVKSLATFSTLAIMQRLSKQHPKAAILLTAVLDSAYAGIVVNNFHVAAR